MTKNVVRDEIVRGYRRDETLDVDRAHFFDVYRTSRFVDAVHSTYE